MFSDKPIFYILKGKKPVPVHDMSDMSAFAEMDRSEKWRVDSSIFHGYWISTVFLGVDHGFGLTDKPVLFETMLFDKEGGPLDMRRCCTWEEAVEQHKDMLYELSVEMDIDLSYITNSLKQQIQSLTNDNLEPEKNSFSTASEFIEDLIFKMS